MEGGFCGPHMLAEVEHPLSHDAHASPRKSLFKDTVVPACLAALTDAEIFSEEFLAEDPLLKGHPLAAPALVVRVIGMGQFHSLGDEVPVERHPHAEEYFAHCVPPLVLLRDCSISVDALHQIHRSRRQVLDIKFRWISRMLIFSPPLVARTLLG